MCTWHRGTSGNSAPAGTQNWKSPYRGDPWGDSPVHGFWALGMGPPAPSPAPGALPAAGLAPLQSHRWSCHCPRSYRCCCRWMRGGPPLWWGAALPGKTRPLQAPLAHLASWQSASRTHPGGGRSRAHDGSQVPRHVQQGAACDVAQHHHSLLGCWD